MPSAAAATPPMPRTIRSSRSVSSCRRASTTSAPPSRSPGWLGVPVLPRGGGTSQCGQTVGEALVVDCSKYLDQVLDLDLAARRVRVAPGLVLDRLNKALAPHGLFFPVDPSTASRATLGGMAGNNSCGARSLRYGLMRDNVAAIDALLADGSALTFGETANGDADPRIAALRDLARREAGEIARRFPTLSRRVGGYNLDALVAGGAGDGPANLGELLVGSEGTLAFFTALDLRLQPIPPARGARRLPFPQLLRGHGGDQGDRRPRPDRRRAGRPHAARPGPGDAGVPGDHRAGRARPPRGPAAGRVRRRGGRTRYRPG